MSSAKTQKAPSVVAQYGPSMARNALLQPQALHRFWFGNSLKPVYRQASHKHLFWHASQTSGGFNTARLRLFLFGIRLVGLDRRNYRACLLCFRHFAGTQDLLHGIFVF